MQYIGFCSRLFGCVGVRIINFYAGSIGVNAEFIFEETAPTTGSMVADEILNEAAASDNDIGSELFIVPSETRANGKCFK